VVYICADMFACTRDISSMSDFISLSLALAGKQGLCSLLLTWLA